MTLFGSWALSPSAIHWTLMSRTMLASNRPIFPLQRLQRKSAVSRPRIDRTAMSRFDTGRRLRSIPGKTPLLSAVAATHPQALVSAGDRSNPVDLANHFPTVVPATLWRPRGRRPSATPAMLARGSSSSVGLPINVSRELSDARAPVHQPHKWTDVVVTFLTDLGGFL